LDHPLEGLDLFFHQRSGVDIDHMGPGVNLTPCLLRNELGISFPDGLLNTLSTGIDPFPYNQHALPPLITVNSRI
jgi:hypothetical protein